ncbi:uncharacterized protein LOC110232334, partial [Exaiptasia diaphana]|uniref:VWFA domain-containing protein n=1 Tax=Exaiptasia diaphana TaxID=2652724 RepID=A0A913WRW3_EXADI
MAENCSTLIGVIVDVSGSMKRNIGDGVHEEGGEWIQSLFRVIDSLITHDVSDSNHMFAIGMGANNPRTIFDVLRTIEDFKNIKTNQTRLNHASTIDSILTILESAGACAVRKWASASAIGEKVSHDDAKKLLYYVKSRPGFAKGVVNSCLPNACKGIENNSPEFVGYIPFAHLLLRSGESAVSTFRPAGEKEIKDAIEKAKSLLEEDFLIREVDVQSSIFTVKEAWGILRGSVDKDKLTNQRVQELMDDVRPFIYGGSTPFYESLEMALQLFTFSPKFKYHKKLLLVISDGYPTDDPFFTKKDLLIAKFRETDITIVSCFITRLHDDVEPKRLFSKDYHWEDGAKLLFELSSKIPADLVPRTIFVKRGWKIDITNNETKLFLQVNHPVFLKDVCDLARNVVCCQDALADALTSVSLDIYINQSRNDFGAKKQEGGTSYANASAAVLYLSMKRILGRQGGYPEFNDLRQELIDEYGEDGA